MSAEGHTGRYRADGPAFPARTPGDGRRRNRALILELVSARGPTTRGELATAGSLSAPTVLEIVDGLIGEGLIREDGVRPSTGGRRPRLLTLEHRARCSVGLAVGSRTLTAVVTDLRGGRELRIETPSEMNQGPETLLERVREILCESLGSIPTGLGRPLGIGLVLPAPITALSGEEFSLPTRSEWGRIQLGEVVARELGLPVLVDNVANAAALGENLFGAGRDVRNMFYIIAQRGIGGAMVIDGRLYRGADGGAGEIGHTRLEFDGPRCGCGNYGCLEAYVGRVAIRQRAVRALQLAGRREMAGKAVEEVRAQDVIDAGLAGDELAQEVLRETGRYLGLGISNVVHLFNPELVVVGGSTMRAGGLVLEPAVEVVCRQVLPSVASSVRVVPGELGEDAGAVGAAAFVLRELFAVSVPAEED